MHHLRVGKCAQRAKKYFIKQDAPNRPKRQVVLDVTETDWPTLETDYDHLVTSIQSRKIKKPAAA